MNGGMNMLAMGMASGMNPASHPSPASPPNSMMPGMNSTPMTATGLIAMGHHPNNQPAMMSPMHPMAYGREQKMMMPTQQQMHRQHQQQQQSPQYDRPRSSSSIHSTSNQQQMMPPPPRPPTAQSSRPGTAMDMRTRAASSMAGGSPPANMSGMNVTPIQPPPASQSLENGMMSATGIYTPIQPSSTPGSMSPPPQPGSPSPYRPGMQSNPMKRKLPDQSPIAMNMSGGPMNMTNMSPTHSLNGFTPPQIQGQTQHQRNSPGPMINAMNMAMNGMAGMNNVSMGLSQQSPMATMTGMPNFDLNNTIGMPIGMSPQPPTPSQSQMMSQQQPMMVSQGTIPEIQQPLRQGSLPPTVSTPQVNSLSSSPVKAPPTRLPSVAPPTSIPPATPTLGSTMAEPSTPAALVPSASNPSLPPNVNIATTRVSVVPLLGSDKTIPPLEPEEISQIQGWMQVDKEYEGRYKKMKDRVNEELKSETFGPLTIRWWEKGAVSTNPGLAMGLRPRTRENFDVRYGRKKDRDTGRSRKPGRREGLKLPRSLDPAEANCAEQLVPIRLEFDVEHHRMRDTFIWNLNDPVVTPEHFAQTVVEDYNLSSNYHSIIAKAIHDQLNDFKTHSNNYDGEGGEFLLTESTLQTGNLDDKSAAWWEAWRKRLRTEYGAHRAGKRAGKRRKRLQAQESLMLEERPMHVHEFPLNEEAMFEDMRILIKLDIIVGSVKLDDQFEWDLDNTSASPEQFAEVYGRELGLGGEFQTAIAHSIREQVQTYQKSLFLVGHASDGSPIQDEDLKLSILPTLMSGTRSMDQVPSFTPLLNYLSDGEVERHEKERDKEMNRRKKRNTRGRRGVTLPDREPIRTYRTPAIGFPELDAATQALAAAATAPARRAAAAAASVTIANMVASENGTPFLPQQSVQPAPQPIPTVPKKKPKGLFKAPPIPQEVLHARALVAAPTSSTAVDVSTLPPPLENDPPPSTTAAPVPRIMVARRPKETEREAKEKEFADGQHANFIDGVWHCSNCGCPEGIAIGRRKGPLGEKSQCGTCGKYWHRHRRPRPVSYSTDPEFHTALKRESEIAKTIAKKKGGAAALRAQSATVPTTPELPSEPQTPHVRDDDRAVSPVSTVSSGSEPPLAHKVEANGTTLVPPAEPPAVLSPKDPADQQPLTTETSPSWLVAAMQATRLKYPNDRFGVTLRRVNATSVPEWRIKCVDCPGKLYKPGPGETLSNFEVHLKNRQHRQRVDERVNGGDP